MAARRRDRLEFASRVSGGRRRWPRPAGSRDRPARPAPMVAPSAPRDARSKIPPGPEGSNGIDRRGRRGQPAGPPPFRALESASASPFRTPWRRPEPSCIGLASGGAAATVSIDAGAEASRRGRHLFGAHPGANPMQDSEGRRHGVRRGEACALPPARRESAAGRAPLYEQRIDVEPGLPGWRQRRERSGASPASGC